MKNLRVILMTLLVYSFVQTVVPAQQEKRNATPSTAPTGLALEVTYWKGDAPTYQTVPGWAWYARFRSLDSAKQAKESLPVKAVNIASKMEGESVSVVVSLHVGDKFFEREDLVGKYTLGLNEKISVKEMTAFGLEPFEIGLTKVPPMAESLPAVSNKTVSVEIVGMQPFDSTFPMYKLVLRNNSDKNVSALYIETFANGKLRLSSMPRSKEGKALIAARSAYEYKRELNKTTRQTNAGYTPETPVGQSVVITTAVFDDGTYEGDAQFAARARAFALGERTQLARLIASYQKALDDRDTDPKNILGRLKWDVTALGTDVDQSGLYKLTSAFPTFTEQEKKDLGAAAEISMFSLKKETLEEINKLAAKDNPPVDRRKLRSWIRENRDRFQKWLDRIENL